MKNEERKVKKYEDTTSIHHSLFTIHEKIVIFAAQKLHI
jgi:hypothetical protein